MFKLLISRLAAAYRISTAAALAGALVYWYFVQSPPFSPRDQRTVEIEDRPCVFPGDPLAHIAPWPWCTSYTLPVSISTAPDHNPADQLSSYAPYDPELEADLAFAPGAEWDLDVTRISHHGTETTTDIVSFALNPPTMDSVPPACVSERFAIAIRDPQRIRGARNACARVGMVLASVDSVTDAADVRALIGSCPQSQALGVHAADWNEQTWGSSGVAVEISRGNQLRATLPTGDPRPSLCQLPPLTRPPVRIWTSPNRAVLGITARADPLLVDQMMERYRCTGDVSPRVQNEEIDALLATARSDPAGIIQTFFCTG
ncbi:hypothetical protein BC828DRAFT_404031 [Blastocladiella britannica]|nr:hypothetical protein BC828DRAFT_404031 [Blastocladiella britannica]